MTEHSSRVDRRSFLRQVSAAAFVFPVVGLNLLGSSCATHSHSWAGPAVAEDKGVVVPWNTVIVSDREPGESLIVSGTIYSPDGKSPLAGANIYVYQTDATGHYSTSGGDNRGTRIHGLMRTGAEGRYEFRTIKPAPYPGRTNPAHIHVFLSAPGYPEYWTEDFLFDGDPFITEEMRRKSGVPVSFPFILKLTRGKDGILRGVRDFKIERCANNCTGR